MEKDLIKIVLDIKIPWVGEGNHSVKQEEVKENLCVQPAVRGGLEADSSACSLTPAARLRSQAPRATVEKAAKAEAGWALLGSLTPRPPDL